MTTEVLIEEKEMTQRYEEVLTVLKALMPAMEADGGGVELVGIDADSVKVRLKGACLICPSVSLTMKYGISETLLTALPWVKNVVRVA